MYEGALLIFSILALAALWFASYGGFHQAFTNYRVGHTEAITPARFAGVCLANSVWVLYACGLETINIPLAFGCGAWVLVGVLNLIQMELLPPSRSPFERVMIVVVLLLSAAGIGVASFARESLFAWRDQLEWASVTSTIVFVHSGQILQLLHTKKRNTLDGLSRWDIIAPFVDWSVFIVYSCLLGPIQYWPVMLNSLLGFGTSGARVLQYRRLKRGLSR